MKIFIGLIIFLFSVINSNAQWEAIYNPEKNVASQIISTDNQLIVASRSKIFTSSNEGISWDERLHGKSDNYFFTQLYLHKGSLYTYSYDDQDAADIYTSNDNGNTWQTITSDFPVNEFILNIIAFKDRIIIQTVDGVYEYDSGKWKNVSYNLEGDFLYDIIVWKDSLYCLNYGDELFVFDELNGNWDLTPFYIEDIVYDLFVFDNELYVDGSTDLFHSSDMVNWLKVGLSQDCHEIYHYSVLSNEGQIIINTRTSFYVLEPNKSIRKVLENISPGANFNDLCFHKNNYYFAGIEIIKINSDFISGQSIPFAQNLPSLVLPTFDISMAQPNVYFSDKATTYTYNTLTKELTISNFNLPGGYIPRIFTVNNQVFGWSNVTNCENFYQLKNNDWVPIQLTQNAPILYDVTSSQNSMYCIGENILGYGVFEYNPSTQLSRRISEIPDEILNPNFAKIYAIQDKIILFDFPTLSYYENQVWNEFQLPGIASDIEKVFTGDRFFFFLLADGRLYSFDPVSKTQVLVSIFSDDIEGFYEIGNNYYYTNSPYGLYISEDKGSTWKDISPSFLTDPIGEDQYVTKLIQSSGFLYFCSYNGVYRRDLSTIVRTESLRLKDEASAYYTPDKIEFQFENILDHSLWVNAFDAKGRWFDPDISIENTKITLHKKALPPGVYVLCLRQRQGFSQNIPFAIW